MRAEGKRIAGGAVALVAALLVVIVFAGAPDARADFKAADAMCAASKCNPSNPKGPPCPSITCFDETNKAKTMGKCVSSAGGGICKAESAQTVGGDMKGIVDALKLIKDLFGQKQQGGGGGAPPTQQPMNPYPFCVYNAATKTYSPIPCMNVDGSVNYGTTGIDPLTGLPLGSSNIADQLLNALGGSVSEELSEVADPTKIGDQLVEIPGEVPSEGTQASSTDIDAQTLESSLFGDIYVGDSDATIFARTRDPASNTEVAGFFGGASAVPGSAPGLVGRLCGARPWAGGFLARVIPETFFDGLCKRAGYQVGAIAVTPSGVGGSAAPKAPVAPKEPEKILPPPAQNPEADVWAEPANVRLGTRTYIFWTSNEVTSCKVTGPSFEQSAPSGGASTVPLSDASTFKIVCEVAGGGTVEDSVTVRLAL